MMVLQFLVYAPDQSRRVHIESLTESRLSFEDGDYFTAHARSRVHQPSDNRVRSHSNRHEIVISMIRDKAPPDVPASDLPNDR